VLKVTALIRRGLTSEVTLLLLDARMPCQQAVVKAACSASRCYIAAASVYLRRLSTSGPTACGPQVGHGWTTWSIAFRFRGKALKKTSPRELSPWIDDREQAGRALCLPPRHKARRRPVAESDQPLGLRRANAGLVTSGLVQKEAKRGWTTALPPQDYHTRQRHLGIGKRCARQAHVNKCARRHAQNATCQTVRGNFNLESLRNGGPSEALFDQRKEPPVPGFVRGSDQAFGQHCVTVRTLSVNLICFPVRQQETLLLGKPKMHVFLAFLPKSF